MSSAGIWDPLRRKRVSETPEERVRQWFISILADTCHVPKTLMMSEVPIERGVGASKKRYRADIVVYDRSCAPLMIVECKRDSVDIDASTLRQVLRYEAILGVPFIGVTNGIKTFVASNDESGLHFLSSLPTYEEMLNGKAAEQDE